MSSFPSYVKVTVDSFSETHGKVALRTAMDRGVPKQRRVQSDVMVTVALKLVFMTDADAEAFEEWYYASVMTWFDWTDPRTRTVRTARSVSDSLGPLLPGGPLFGQTSRTLQIEYKRPL